MVTKIAPPVDFAEQQRGATRDAHHVGRSA